VSTEVSILSTIKIRGISEVADNLLVSPKELCSMELVSEFNNATLNQRRRVAGYCLQEQKTPLHCMRRICVAVRFIERT
jgi:hypothetical protein